MIQLPALLVGAACFALVASVAAQSAPGSASSGNCVGDMENPNCPYYSTDYGCPKLGCYRGFKYCMRTYVTCEEISSESTCNDYNSLGCSWQGIGGSSDGRLGATIGIAIASVVLGVVIIAGAIFVAYKQGLFTFSSSGSSSTSSGSFFSVREPGYAPLEQPMQTFQSHGSYVPPQAPAVGFVQPPAETAGVPTTSAAVGAPVLVFSSNPTPSGGVANSGFAPVTVEPAPVL